MRIPRYWARAEGETPPGVDGDPRVSVWGWSEQNQREAERHAQQRLTEVLDRLHRGLGFPKGYAYGTRALREEILEELRDRSGRVEALLTRNAYGSVVLNAAQILFVDVDVPPPALIDRIARLFGSRKLAAEELVLSRIREALHHDSGGSYRVYRTAAGFRVLATDPLFAPNAPHAIQIMERLGADPAFVQLCKVQESFRARLTPKPWRCGQANPPGSFPRHDSPVAGQVCRMDQGIRGAADKKATCRFVETIGPGRTHRDAAVILRLHDERTKASVDLPLA